MKLSFKLLISCFIFIGLYFRLIKTKNPLPKVSDTLIKIKEKDLTLEKKDFPKEIIVSKERKERETKTSKQEDFIGEYSNKSSLFFLKSMSVACDDACEAEWQNFLQDPKTVYHSQKVLSDLAYAQQAHGDQQAYARVLALESLKKSAAEKGPEVLEQTIQETLKALVRNQYFKGARHDLTDLLELWINSYGKELVLANPELIFSKFSYQPNYKDIFVAALGNSFPEMASDRQQSKKIMELFKSYE